MANRYDWNPWQDPDYLKSTVRPAVRSAYPLSKGEEDGYSWTVSDLKELVNANANDKEWDELSQWTNSTDDIGHQPLTPNAREIAVQELSPIWQSYNQLDKDKENLYRLSQHGERGAHKLTDEDIPSVIDTLERILAVLKGGQGK